MFRRILNQIAMPRQSRAHSHVWFTCRYTRENGGYVIRCLELNISSQGDTLEEARDNILEAIQLYLETYGIPESLKESEQPPFWMPVEIPV